MSWRNLLHFEGLFNDLTRSVLDELSHLCKTKCGSSCSSEVMAELMHDKRAEAERRVTPAPVSQYSEGNSMH